MDETTPTRPVNAYGASKLAVDGMIADECRAHGLGAVSLRYFNVAGASGCLGEDHEPETHLIPNVLRAAQGLQAEVQVFGTDYPTPDGTAVRDYIHIEDLASAHLLALDGARPGEHRIFNLGNGNGFSVREVIDAARAVTGLEIPVREAPRRPGDPPMLVAASGRIRAELGWEPRKPALADMVGDAWAFAQSHPRGYAGEPAARQAVEPSAGSSAEAAHATPRFPRESDVLWGNDPARGEEQGWLGHDGRRSPWSRRSRLGAAGCGSSEKGTDVRRSRSSRPFSDNEPDWTLQAQEVVEEWPREARRQSRHGRRVADGRRQRRARAGLATKATSS